MLLRCTGTGLPTGEGEGEGEGCLMASNQYLMILY